MRRLSRFFARWRLKRTLRAFERTNPYRGDGIPPPPFQIEPAFDEFVVRLGGQKVADLLTGNSDRPKNADYFFKEANVVAELKSLEGGTPPFGSPLAFVKSLRDGGATDRDLADHLIRGTPLPTGATDMVRKRYRRMIEDRVRKARVQLRTTKEMFGDSSTRCLLLIANDKYTFASQAWLFGQICGVMTNYAADDVIDGVVFLSPNIFSRPVGAKREYGLWAPAYRDETNTRLCDFVNDLGHRWLKHEAELMGEPGLEPLQIDDWKIAQAFLKLPIDLR